MRIIPAIDIIDGKCVRLTKGNYETQKIYSENPLEMAKKFENSGIEFLHLVDLDGAKFGKITNHKVLYQISKNTNLKIDFGGGLKKNKDLEIAFENGAQQITAGSIAVKNPELLKQWILKFGNEKIILGADVHNEKIAISGWTETSEENAVSFIEKYKNLGLKKVICTDISKDGMLEGPSFLLYEKILKSVAAIDLIASGGITTIEDLNKLKLLRCEGAIIGKAIYEGRISLKEIEKFITQ